MTGHPTTAVCRALHVARSTAYLRPQPRAGGFYRRSTDREVLLDIMSVVRERASYGVRRVHALVNRSRRAHGATPYNRKWASPDLVDGLVTLHEAVVRTQPG